MQKLDAPSLVQGEQLAAQPPDGVDVDAPTQDDALTIAQGLAAAARESRDAARRAADEQLADAAMGAAQSSQDMNDANAQATDVQAVVVATVAAPRAIDADGKRVDTTLSVDGDVVTMHVDHKGEDITYPIAADPEYQVMPTRWHLAWYPELRAETYVDHWATGYNYVGTWHPVFCAWGWVRCAGAGGPWFNAWNAGGTHSVAYWPGWDWGPVWQDYWYPVFGTRWVVARWVPYFEVDPTSMVAVEVLNSGGSEVVEPGDDDGDVDFYNYSAGARAASVRPHCRRVDRHITVVGYGGGAEKFRFCWNASKYKVSLDSQYDNHTEASVLWVWRLAGLGTANERFSPHVLTNQGHPRGALDAHASFDWTGSVGLGPLSAGATIGHRNWGTVAYYTGDVCHYNGGDTERRRTCGPTP